MPLRRLTGKLLIAVLALFAPGCGASTDAGSGQELLNVSYDPTRELWRDLNRQFISKFERDGGSTLTINQSHGGSSTQARAVIDGLAADVVTLAMPSDTNKISESGQLAEGWEDRLPEKSLPYYSTVIFVVRKGNPKGIKDWPDLVNQPDIAIVTPNPKTSGNGQLSFYSAWGSVTTRGGSEQQAREFVTALYKRAPVLDAGARGSTTTFVQRRIGDVHLAWENEAHLEVRKARGELELIYPPVSIRAEPKVALVDANVDRNGTRPTAEAYLNNLFSDDAQETIAKHYFRPINREVLLKHSSTFPAIQLFVITDIAQGWEDAHKRFIADGGVFDSIYRPESEQ